MIKNKKGFTLVELLAVIVILGLVLVIAIPSVINTFSNSKKETEKVFLGNIENAIEQYIEYNKKDFSFTNYKMCGNTGNEQCYINKTTDSLGGTAQSKVFKGSASDNKLKLSAVVSAGILGADEIINPNNKEVECYTTDDNPEIKLYRDEDFVYCFKVDLSCVDGDTDINTCDDFSVDVSDS